MYILSNVWTVYKYDLRISFIKKKNLADSLAQPCSHFRGYQLSKLFEQCPDVIAAFFILAKQVQLCSCPSLPWLAKVNWHTRFSWGKGVMSSCVKPIHKYLVILSCAHTNDVESVYSIIVFSVLIQKFHSQYKVIGLNWTHCVFYVFQFEKYLQVPQYNIHGGQ